MARPDPETLRNIRFGELSVGADFWENPSLHDWWFSYTKINPQVIYGIAINAISGSVLFGYEDDAIVRIKKE